MGVLGLCVGHNQHLGNSSRLHNAGALVSIRRIFVWSFMFWMVAFGGVLFFAKQQAYGIVDEGIEGRVQ